MARSKEVVRPDSSTPRCALLVRLRTSGERPCARCAYKGDYEFSPSDVDCHVICSTHRAHAMEAMISRFDRAGLGNRPMSARVKPELSPSGLMSALATC